MAAPRWKVWRRRPDCRLIATWRTPRRSRTTRQAGLLSWSKMADDLLSRWRPRSRQHRSSPLGVASVARPPSGARRGGRLHRAAPDTISLGAVTLALVRDESESEMREVLIHGDRGGGALARPSQSGGPR